MERVSRLAGGRTPAGRTDAGAAGEPSGRKPASVPPIEHTDRLARRMGARFVPRPRDPVFDEDDLAEDLAAAVERAAAKRVGLVRKPPAKIDYARYAEVARARATLDHPGGANIHG